MATVSSTMSLRSDVTLNTASNLVLSFNTMHDLVVSSGMVQVADDEYIGQAKIFSENAGVGLTQVVRQVSVQGLAVKGFKVYKHPSLSFYIKINFIDYILRANEQGFVSFSYQVCDLLVLGAFDVSRESPVFSFQKLGVSNPSVTALNYAKTAITASCGVDYFWIARQQGFNAQNNDLNSRSFASNYIDPIGIGIFSSSKDNAVLCITTGQEVASIDTNFAYSSPANSKYITGINYTSYSDGLWTKKPSCSAGYLLDTETPNTENGIRVAQALLVISGQQHRFNFGFINASILPEFEVVNINLSGISQSYQHIPSIGSASPSYTSAAKSSLCSVLMPIS